MTNLRETVMSSIANSGKVSQELSLIEEHPRSGQTVSTHLLGCDGPFGRFLEKIHVGLLRLALRDFSKH